MYWRVSDIPIFNSMRRLYYLSVLALLMMTASALNAQDGKVLLGVRAGHSAPFGGFAAVSVEADHDFNNVFSLLGGAQYNTIGRTAVEVRPSYFHDFGRGRLSAEILMHYTNQFSIANVAMGAGLGYKGRFLQAKLGYYYRLYGGTGDWIKEAFNIYYELGVNCLPMFSKWDLNVLLTNNEIFELERHFQVTYILQGCYYPIDNVGITLSLNYKPAGMFNMSTDYYQLSSKLGICYRW